jgi:hypothetical protein
VDAYVEETEAAQKRMSEAREGGDREKFMAVYRENAKQMQKVLEDNLTEEQAKKADALVGRFGGLDRSIQALLRTEVEEAKVEKALPVLVNYALAQQELFTKMREGSISREDIMGKFTELREKTVKELTPIVGEKAAATWQERSGMRRMGRGGGGGQGGGQRGGGGQ